MTYGKIVFNNELTLDIKGLSLKNGQVITDCEGTALVSSIPTGVIPWVMYGIDNSLICVGSTDMTTLHNESQKYTDVTIRLEGDIKINVAG